MLIVKNNVRLTESEWEQLHNENYSAELQEAMHMLLYSYELVIINVNGAIANMHIVKTGTSMKDEFDFERPLYVIFGNPGETELYDAIVVHGENAVIKKIAEYAIP